MLTYRVVGTMDPPTTRAPTFLLLGAAKCGTTSLAHYLAQHPEICFSDPKEPVFFEAQYELGLDWYWRRYFCKWSGEPAAGEGRPWNLYLPYVAPRIRESLPEARLLVLLRDPVERVFSHWWHRYSRGLETLGFEEALRSDRARIERGERFEGDAGERQWREGLVPDGPTTRHRVLLDLGFYVDQVERFLALFPRSQLKTIFYEDLAAEPRGTLRSTFAFLGVRRDAEIADLSAQNVGRQHRRGPLARKALFGIRAFGLQRLVPRTLRPRIHRLAERPAQRPPLAAETRRELVAYYEPWTRRLEELTGRDLSAWRRPEAG